MQDKPVSLDSEQSVVWWLGHAVGITLIPCIGCAVPVSIIELFMLIGLCAVLCEMILWLILREKVSKSWRWIVVGFLTWGLTLAIATAFHFRMADFLEAASQVPTGSAAVIFFWLIILVVGYLIRGLVLLLANLYFEGLMRF